MKHTLKHTLKYMLINSVLCVIGFTLIILALGLKEQPIWFSFALSSLYYLGNFLGYTEGSSK